MSVLAYKRAQTTVSDPRENEYRLFAQVTRALMEARDEEANAESGRSETYFKTVNWNRSLWMTLATDLSMPGNQLPDQLKAQLLSLAIWVGRETGKVIRGESSVSPFIEVNRAIMAGLAERPN